MIDDIKQNFIELETYLNKQVIGQSQLVTELLIALLADGHILVEGAPGVAKTRAVKILADCIESDFHRIQFTPDLLPADLTGSDIFRPATSEFVFQKGPIFHSLILADEINRAPAKVQAAMLEAMAEKQITVGKKTYPLPDLFLVMATQNPLEQEGTYSLPEAQLDRFMMHLDVNYPNIEDELAILRLNRGEMLGDCEKFSKKITAENIFEARRLILKTHMAEDVEKYIIRLVHATRSPELYDKELAQWIDMGVSPRATIALDKASRAFAWLQNRDHVLPQDVQTMAYPVLRHRLLLNYTAHEYSKNDIITRLIEVVTCP